MESVLSGSLLVSNFKLKYPMEFLRQASFLCHVFLHDFPNCIWMSFVRKLLDNTHKILCLKYCTN